MLQFLTFYELDLGLNHVVRKWSEPTDRKANMLVQGQLPADLRATPLMQTCLQYLVVRTHSQSVSMDPLAY